MSYEAFAAGYDALTQNVDYDACAAFLCAALKRYGIDDGLVLDLACGTGTVTAALAAAGYTLIGADASADMLAVAQQKMQEKRLDALFLCQDMGALDLYGTVRAAVCTLDSLNHLPNRAAVEAALSRVSLFLEPGGVFVFDVNTPYKHREVLADNTFVYDTPAVYCVWQNTPLPGDAVEISLDFFFPTGKDAYRRAAETFTERAYAPAEWADMLQKAGLTILEMHDGYTDAPPREKSERVVYVTRKEPV